MQASGAPGRIPPWVLVIFFLILFLVVAGKNSFNEIRYPILYNEDGRYFFPAFLGPQDFDSLFKKLASSYLQMIPYLVAYLIGFLPVSLVPSAYAVLSLTITTITLFLFYFVFIRLGISSLVSFTLVLFLAALPLGNAALSSTLAWQHFNSVVILMLLQWLPLPAGRTVKLLYLLVVHALIWSHPLSVVILPVFIYRAVREIDGRVLHAFCAVSALTYYFTGTSGASPDFKYFPFFYDILMERVVLESIIGPSPRAYLQFLGFSGGIAALIVLILVAAWARRWKVLSAEAKFVFISSAYFILSTTFVAVMTRELDDLYLHFQALARYVYIPKVIFAGLFSLSLFLLTTDSMRARTGNLVFLGLVLWLAGYQSPVYRTDVEAGKKVLAFARKIEEAKRQCGDAQPSRVLTLERGSFQAKINERIWTINVRVCEDPARGGGRGEAIRE